MISGADGGQDLGSFLTPSGEVNPLSALISNRALICLRSYLRAAYHSRIVPVRDFGCAHSV